MNGKFIVKSRHPHNAFGRFSDVPSDQDKIYKVSEHKISPKGLKNALKVRAQESEGYAESHGNCAVHAEWIEVDGEKYDAYILGLMLSCGSEFNSLVGFKESYQESVEILRETRRELDARYAAEESE